MSNFRKSRKKGRQTTVLGVFWALFTECYPDKTLKKRPSRALLVKFREKTKINPQGFQFAILCLKCGFKDCDISINGEASQGNPGCSTCGYGCTADLELSVVIKCPKCGNAFKLEKNREV